MVLGLQGYMDLPSGNSASDIEYSWLQSGIYFGLQSEKWILSHSWLWGQPCLQAPSLQLGKSVTSVREMVSWAIHDSTGIQTLCLQAKLRFSWRNIFDFSQKKHYSLDRSQSSPQDNWLGLQTHTNHSVVSTNFGTLSSATRWFINKDIWAHRNLLISSSGVYDVNIQIRHHCWSRHITLLGFSRFILNKQIRRAPSRIILNW